MTSGRGIDRLELAGRAMPPREGTNSASAGASGLGAIRHPSESSGSSREVRRGQRIGSERR